MARKEPNSRNGTAKTHLLDTAQRIVGAKGFAGVGLNQLLGAAGIPKGSFYYYFASKEAFGKELLAHYFEKDLLQIDKFLSEPGRTARDRLIAYWRFFRANQEHDDPDGKCLAVKLGAEVSDMSEDMRLTLKARDLGYHLQTRSHPQRGDGGRFDRDLQKSWATAQTLYQLWMGASVMAKISHDRGAFIHANATTERILAGEAL